MLKRIHVNQHIIRHNRKTGATDPPITIKVGGQNLRAHTVKIRGPSQLVYRPEKPLSCGAHLWIETRADLEIT